MITLPTIYEAERNANPALPLLYVAEYSMDDGANWTAFPTNGELILPLGRLTQETENPEFTYLGPDLELTCNNSTGFWTKQNQTGLLDGTGRVMVRVYSESPNDGSNHVYHLLGYVDLASVKRQEGGYCSFIVRGVLNTLDAFMASYEGAGVELTGLCPHKFNGALHIVSVGAGHENGLYRLKYYKEDDTFQWNNGPRTKIVDDTETALEGSDGKTLTIKLHYKLDVAWGSGEKQWQPYYQGSGAEGPFLTEDTEQWIAIKQEVAYEPLLVKTTAELFAEIDDIVHIDDTNLRAVPTGNRNVYPFRASFQATATEKTKVSFIGGFVPGDCPLTSAFDYAWIVTRKNNKTYMVYGKATAYDGNDMVFSDITITEIWADAECVAMKRVANTSGSGSDYIYWFALDLGSPVDDYKVWGTNVVAYLYDTDDADPVSWKMPYSIDLNYQAGGDKHDAEVAFRSIQFMDDRTLCFIARPNYEDGVYNKWAPVKATHNYVTTTITEMASRADIVQSPATYDRAVYAGPYPSGQFYNSGYFYGVVFNIINRHLESGYTTYSMSYKIKVYKVSDGTADSQDLPTSGKVQECPGDYLAYDAITRLAFPAGSTAETAYFYLHNLVRAITYWPDIYYDTTGIYFREMEPQAGLYNGRRWVDWSGSKIAETETDGADGVYFVDHDGYEHSETMLALGNAEAWQAENTSSPRAMSKVLEVVDSGAGVVRAGAYDSTRIYLLYANDYHLVLCALDYYNGSSAYPWRQLAHLPNGYQENRSYREVLEDFAKAQNARINPHEHGRELELYSKESLPDTSGTITLGQYVFDLTWERRLQYKAVSVNGYEYSAQLYTTEEVLSISSDQVHPSTALALAKFIYDNLLDTERLHKIITDWLVEYEPGDRVSFEINDENGNTQTEDALIISTETDFDNRTHAMILLEIEGD